MINERKEAQSEIEVVMLEQLVPQDHLLRKIDKYIDFSFIRDLTRICIVIQMVDQLLIQ